MKVSGGIVLIAVGPKVPLWSGAGPVLFENDASSEDKSSSVGFLAHLLRGKAIDDRDSTRAALGTNGCVIQSTIYIRWIGQLILLTVHGAGIIKTHWERSAPPAII
jgi:hypothetical protein